MPRPGTDISGLRQPYNRYPSWPASDVRLSKSGSSKSVSGELGQPQTAPAAVNRKYCMQVIRPSYALIALKVIFIAKKFYIEQL